MSRWSFCGAAVLMLALPLAHAVHSADTAPATPAAAPDKLAGARACAGPCEEHDDLKRGIDRFKANGNKYAAEAR